MDEERIPSGRIGRLSRLARLGAATGASLALSRDGKRAAAMTAEVLGQLRGLAAKVGQMASYVDGVVPEAHREAYEAALKTLQSRAPTSSAEAVRAVIEAELGASVGRLFDDFQDEPLASASIGQVHRAVLDSRPVAVKVQHPGIERAVAADLDSAGVMSTMVAALGPRDLEIKRTFAELRTRFTEELDYDNEADNQESFRRMHAGDPDVVVPAVFRDRSSRRVLTTELVTGATLDQVAALPEDVRRTYAEVLWRFVFRSVLIHRTFNADPHPGNYVFLPEGRVAFLDYGCVQPISVEHNKMALAVHRAALDRDEAAFAEATRLFLGTRGGPYEDAAVAYVRSMFAPIFSERFHITRSYVAGLVKGVQEMKRFTLQKGSGFVPMKPGMLFMNRLQYGFFSVLARLDVDIGYAAIEEDILRSAGKR